MLVLAIDASNQALTVALATEQQLLGTVTLNVKQTHSEGLMPAIEYLFQATKKQPAAIDRVAVAQGPGSYTGIRIAVTTAKTLAWTLGKQLVGVSSLAVLASNIPAGAGLIVPLFDARRSAVFTGAYRWQQGQLVNVLADRHIAMAEWLPELVATKQPLTFVGDTAAFSETLLALGEQAQIAATNFDLPQAGQLAQLGLQLPPVTDIHGFVPNYLRMTEAETNWLKQHPDNEGHEPYVEEI
ncbi:tRNA (adenosine(37)-N6)-threonylcarbamoyltransferase complex dimerization subunit type 1 TsaB [Loigolactobacillus zhaoyuanensis]|uniref:tRNA (Adenosine(37)-N6)-threonylcarbamoyltransferase complex dimerization subunit type 1 TsaB n=1 Tax=Loigolactobacillus zhaoyuanensis TaxID=2486017 RepID=A0ABW8UEL1_9LACO|nr:tRNA (adenosine(37)-N6)-threonylcarbamoyltransferase complex dimerization subunit type 1 TsaB [Loigolactobacillus zhaoyuanensis]